MTNLETAKNLLAKEKTISPPFLQRKLKITFYEAEWLCKELSRLTNVQVLSVGIR